MRKRPKHLFLQFTQEDQERLIIFLASWFGKNLLTFQDMTDEVKSFMKVEYGCSLKDFLQTVDMLLTKQYMVGVKETNKLMFTIPGIKYVEDLKLKHGDFDIEINFN